MGTQGASARTGTDSKAPPEGSTGISKEVDCRLISVQFGLKRNMSIVKYGVFRQRVIQYDPMPSDAIRCPLDPFGTIRNSALSRPKLHLRPLNRLYLKLRPSIVHLENHAVNLGAKGSSLRKEITKNQLSLDNKYIE